jgi:hypothetical protein
MACLTTTISCHQKKYGTPTVWRHSHPRYIVTAAPKILKRRKEEKAMKTAAMMTKVNKVGT